MEQPAKEIGGVIRALTQGNIEQQEQALSSYFLPNASFQHPCGRYPSLKRSPATFASGTESLWLVIAMYRWYRTLSPHLDIKVDRVDFDHRSGLLYVSLRQTFSMWFIPLYKAPVRLVSVLQLTQQSPAPVEDFRHVATAKSKENPKLKNPASKRPKYYIASQEDLYPETDRLQFLIPGLGRCLWLMWCVWSFWVLALGSLVLAPWYLVLNQRPKRS
ncbi:hypothetical protein B0T10DRAFT_577713 [Thelonectria olida]|uniref:SigF-like NTF2-like domain-containing protein n=1 Tax=Thelonectria olida TaxID=1576542 RepID=A0A9P8WES5_9HYPO|nr:hypothetical protein B0T10DRAFT_577713 [Thelonectria olida]